MRATPCVLVFGVSAVGKSTACLDFVSRHRDFTYFHASSVLGRLTGRTPEELRFSSRDDIIENQRLLAKEIVSTQIKSLNSLLIDAHAVINNGREMVAVPVEVIEFIRPTTMVLLEAKPKEIFERRSTSRKHQSQPTYEDIRRELVSERKAVLAYSSALGTGVQIADVTTGFKLDTLVDAT